MLLNMNASTSVSHASTIDEGVIVSPPKDTFSPSAENMPWMMLPSPKSSFPMPSKHLPR